MRSSLVIVPSTRPPIEPSPTGWAARRSHGLDQPVVRLPVDSVGVAVDHRDSGRLGKAVEHLVAATCILTSELKLNVSTSFVDDEGVDLVFARRGQPKTLAVQVKSRRVTTSSIKRRNAFRAQVRASTFAPRDDLYLLFVAVEPAEGTFDLAWFVPSTVLAQRKTVNSQGRRVFVASTSDTTRDQWSDFRCSRRGLAQRILDAIDQLS